MATIRRFFEGPFNFIDVSNNCGDAERRLGLAEMGGLPDGFVLSTKVDRDPVTGRFDGSRVRRSFEESVTPSWARPRSDPLSPRSGAHHFQGSCGTGWRVGGADGAERGRPRVLDRSRARFRAFSRLAVPRRRGRNSPGKAWAGASVSRSWG